MTENDRKEIKTRQANLEKLKKDALDEITRKKVTGKGTPELDRPQKVDSAELTEAIYRIAIPGSAAHERRRNEVIRTVKALDQLTEALNYEGYDLKRSSVFLHLLPKTSPTLGGKRHVHTAPVKLYKSKIPNIHLIFLQRLHNRAIFGPEEVTFYSMNDNAKVPIGITAAKKQTPLLMHMEYQVTFLDHDFVVGSKHKLIPSVIGD